MGLWGSHRPNVTVERVAKGPHQNATAVRWRVAAERRGGWRLGLHAVTVVSIRRNVCGEYGVYSPQGRAVGFSDGPENALNLIAATALP